MNEAVKKERRRALPALSGFNISEALRALAAEAAKPLPWMQASREAVSRSRIPFRTRIMDAPHP